MFKRNERNERNTDVNTTTKTKEVVTSVGRSVISLIFINGKLILDEFISSDSSLITVSGVNIKVLDREIKRHIERKTKNNLNIEYLKRNTYKVKSIDEALDLAEFISKLERDLCKHEQTYSVRKHNKRIVDQKPRAVILRDIESDTSIYFYKGQMVEELVMSPEELLEIKLT